MYDDLNIVDRFIIDSSDYNIAKNIQIILNNKHIYIGNNNWKYYNNEVNQWYNDKLKKKLINNIEQIVCNLILTKINNLNKIKNEYEIDKQNDINIKVNILLNIINRINNRKKLNNIIKEARQFFTHD
jgi:hypothetical protein